MAMAGSFRNLVLLSKKDFINLELNLSLLPLLDLVVIVFIDYKYFILKLLYLSKSLLIKKSLYIEKSYILVMKFIK